MPLTALTGERIGTLPSALKARAALSAPVE